LLSSASTISRSSSGFHPTPSLIGYGFFFGWAGVCFGCSGVGVGLCSRTIFPSQEMYAPMISSRSFFKLNSISAILCSKVLCSSGICSFLSELPYCREVDSFSRRPSGSAQTADASFGSFGLGSLAFMPSFTCGSADLQWTPRAARHTPFESSSSSPTRRDDL
jgi:hypothetical protein